MNAQQLHEKLKLIHDELDQVESSDGNQREILGRVVTEIKDILSQQDVGREQYVGLGERMKDAVAQIEAAHPKVTLLMRQAIDQLAYMGI